MCWGWRMLCCVHHMVPFVLFLSLLLLLLLLQPSCSYNRHTNRLDSIYSLLPMLMRCPRYI
jgi:hypothetical protein